MNDSQRPLAPVHIGSPRAVSGFAQVDHEWSPEPLEAQNGLGLLDYWQLLKRRRRTALLCLVLGASAGFLFSLPQTPVYRAQVTLEIQGLNREYMGLQDVTPTESGVGGFLGVDIGTQVDLLQSRILLDKAVEKLTPSDYATRGDDLSRILAWRKFLGFPEAGDKERWRDTLEGIRESLKVASFRNSRIVRASVDSTDVAIASDFANALAEAFITENIEARWAATQYTEDWVERQLEDLKIKLEKSEDELQAYAHASGLVFTSEQGSIAVEQLRNLQEDLGAGRAERIARQSTYELVRKYPEASLESAHQQELAALHHDLAALQSIYTDDFPKVRAVKARIREVVRSIKVERDRILDQLKSEYDTALRRESLLQADYRHQAALVSEEARKSIQYNILRREVETSRQLYDNLLQKGKEARLSAALLRSPIRVVDPATPPAYAEGHPAGEMKHGPNALIDENLPIVVIATRDGDNERSRMWYEKTLANIKEVQARKGKVLAIGTQGDSLLGRIADGVIEIPAAHELLLPILEIVPLQLFAYHTAVLRGCDVDQPRNLAKSVTVE